MALEDLEDDMQRSVEELLERTRQHNEDEVRAFVSELLTATANERATALEDGRRVAETESEKAVQAEGDRVRADVEQIWAAKLQQANDTADERFDTGLRAAHEEADRELTRTVASVRDKGQKVLVAALGAAHLESDRTLALRVDQVREEASGRSQPRRRWHPSRRPSSQIVRTMTRDGVVCSRVSGGSTRHRD